MGQHPAPALTTTGRRAAAAVVIRTAAPDLPALAATVAVDLLDGAVGGALAALGLTPEEARAVLYAWWDPER